MPDLTDLQSNRAAIVAALGSGQLRAVFHDGGTRREIEWHSIPGLERALGAIDREIAALSGRRIHTFKATFPEHY